MFENSGHVIGIISVDAFNFIVQEPKGIIVLSRARSRSDRCLIYLSISVSDDIDEKIGCSKNPSFLCNEGFI